MLATEGLQHSRGFIDDLLAGGADWPSYLDHQRDLFRACMRHGWLVTTSKVHLGYTSICVLGHKVSH